MFSTGEIDWTTASVSAVLLSDLYTPTLADQFLSTVPPAAILARAVCTNIAVTNGVCTCLIPQFNSLISGYVCAAVALFIDTGDDTTSTLVYYSSTGNGFPFTLQGFNYYVGPDAASGGWFQV
jgi:hypothetical protein